MASNASTSGEPKNLLEIIKFDGSGFDLWEDRKEGILFQKDYDNVLLETKPTALSDDDWARLNKRMTTLRVLFALCAIFDLKLDQMDVVTAFLHGDLDDELYMQQPEDFVILRKEHMICKLKHTFHADHCLYTRKALEGSVIVLALYVDHMPIADKHKKILNALKKELNSAFSMKDLGPAEHVLDMRITRSRKKHLMFLSQNNYIKKVLERFNMIDAKPLGVPLPPHTKLSKYDCPKDDSTIHAMKSIPYASTCGSLMYDMVATRPNIAYAVRVVSRFMSNPGKPHWEAIKSIFRYLKT
ncbi:hypothetical protein L7F22_025414 [Adiantum nelumboides]|nr:hypothetical protein [Adiantum nelumboides]